MWARTLCPLSSSTLKKALGSDSTTVPSISMAPSFLGISSALRYSYLLLLALMWPTRLAAADSTRLAVSVRQPLQHRQQRNTTTGVCFPGDRPMLSHRCWAKRPSEKPNHAEEEQYATPQQKTTFWAVVSLLQSTRQ